MILVVKLVQANLRSLGKHGLKRIVTEDDGNKRQISVRFASALKSFSFHVEIAV